MRIFADGTQELLVDGSARSLQRGEPREKHTIGLID